MGNNCAGFVPIDNYAKITEMAIARDMGCFPNCALVAFPITAQNKNFVCHFSEFAVRGLFPRQMAGRARENL